MTTQQSPSVKIDSKISAIVFHRLAASLRSCKKESITPSELEILAVHVIQAMKNKKE